MARDNSGNVGIGDDPNRLLLHFGEPNGIDETNQQNVGIYSNEDVVYVIFGGIKKKIMNYSKKNYLYSR
ncbi:MAG: hypothetical protein H8D45_10805 [Bacteroidetes bacterium]|nr:hypothetical protein [Bacteroidota bacterium]MBL7102745.1 hypothetical protein [Bacteroidales bacterium]